MFGSIRVGHAISPPAPSRAEDNSDGSLLILLVILLVGTLPTWPYSRQWVMPGGTLGTVLVILVILILLGYVPRGSTRAWTADDGGASLPYHCAGKGRLRAFS